MPAAFSRLQLAAALLEYDNDSDNPSAPRRSAQDSAIFAHLRRNPAARPDMGMRRSDYIGVSLPSDTASIYPRKVHSRASRSSVNALRNPFGPEDRDGDDDDEDVEEDDDDRNEHEIEVDLTSWGLDAFMPKEKRKTGKGKGKQAVTDRPPAVTSVKSHQPLTQQRAPLASPKRGLGTSRSLSVGGSLDFYGAHNQGLEKQRLNPANAMRPRSFSNPRDFAGVEHSDELLRPQASLYPNPPPQSIPFPTGSVRSPSPGPNVGFGHERTHSMASMNSRMMLAGIKEDHEQARRHAGSRGTMNNPIPESDNPFALELPSRVSRFDPKAAAHARTLSHGSMGSRMLDDDVSVFTSDLHPREVRYSSTLDLLRPKVLVMPSPLQPIAGSSGPEFPVREGFQISKDGPPLPPGARSSRRFSLTFDAALPNASNLFTPNPLNDLSLSQKTFRGTLVVGGDVENPGSLPRATQDGEQVVLQPPIVEQGAEPVSPVNDIAFKPVARLPGKLFGKSLIDDLETRKAGMRSKQRVFTGDQRPSMMARERPSSTLIDPATLAARSSTQRQSVYGPSGMRPVLPRKTSSNAQPLLNFENDNKLSPSAARLPNTRSVFGVDTLWESEMSKLREIEAIEKAAEERRMKKEEERKERDARKRKKGKGKGKVEPAAKETESQAPSPAIEVSQEPPILPAIQHAPRRAPPVVDEDDESSDSDQEDNGRPTAEVVDPEWHAGSSDEDVVRPCRTTGVGPRYRKGGQTFNWAQPVDCESESDEDIPLAAAIHRSRHRSPRVRPRNSNSDEEKPLSMLLQENKSSHLPSVNLNGHRFADRRPFDDEDEEPLGLRMSKIPSFKKASPEDDDRPLAFHPDHQRRTQYQMMAQQQLLAQTQMQQAQMQSAMYFGVPVGLVNPLMMVPPPMSVPSPPPVQSEAKFGMVDRWRRDVAVDGRKALDS